MKHFLLFLLLSIPVFADFNVTMSAVMDANLDGIPDVVIATNNVLYEFNGLGQGRFDIGQRLPGSYVSTESFHQRDMNGDGKPELLLCAGKYQQVWKASPTGLQLLDSVILDEIVWNSLLADLNGDKLPEIVAAANQLVIFQKRGTKWYEAYRLPPPDASSTVCSGDINGDGCDDLIVNLIENSTVWLLLGQRQGPPRASTLNLGVVTSYPVLADFNGDGKLDMAAATEGGLCLALGNGDATFRPSQVIKVPSEILAEGAYVADMDGDGKPDYVFGELRSSAVVAFPSGLGPLQHLADTEQLTSPNIGDYDGDGHIDLLLNYNLLHCLQLMRNRGDGTFEPGPLLRR